MPDTGVSSLDIRPRKLVENARVALEQGNLEYALDACAQVLKAAPGCVAVRRLQRVARLRHFQGKNRWLAKALGGLSATPYFFGGGNMNPAQSLEIADKLLAIDPTNASALRRLGAAALELELPETAVFAFEAIRELRPADRENLLALGGAWLVAGQPAEALRLADAVLQTRPVDAAAQNLMRAASIAQTVTKGRWETPASFRDKLKDGVAAGSCEPPAQGGTPPKGPDV